MFAVSLDQNNRVMDVFDTDVYVDPGVQVHEITEAQKNQIWQHGRNGDFRYESGTVVFDPSSAPAPTSITMRQARIALHRAGLLSQVDAAITDPEARIEWEYATTVERSSVLVQNLSAGLGLTEQQIDDLFTTAATL